MFLFWFRRSGWDPRSCISQRPSVVPMRQVPLGHWSPPVLVVLWAPSFTLCFDPGYLSFPCPSAQSLALALSPGPSAIETLPRAPVRWSWPPFLTPFSACSLRISTTSTPLRSCFYARQILPKLSYLMHIYNPLPAILKSPKFWNTNVFGKFLANSLTLTDIRLFLILISATSCEYPMHSPVDINLCGYECDAGLPAV